MALFEQAADAILITDANLDTPGPTINYVNAAFCAMTGYTAAELLGRSPRMLQGPKTSRTVLNELRDKLRDGKPFVGNTTNYRKDGTPFEIEWHVSPIRSAGGIVTQYLSIHRDVTVVKRFAKTVEQYVRHLREQRRKSIDRVDELETANARLQSLATTDGLTGAINHRHFHELLGDFGPDHAVGSMLMVDVDHFKSFNDEFGHPAGDRVLQTIARVIKLVAGEKYEVARYGGEEFAVLMPDAEADTALALSERIRREVELVTGLDRPVSVSIGVGTLPGGEGAGRQLLGQADVALYAAKAAGRNRVVHFRHDRASLSARAAAPSCKSQCAPTPAGCARCETVPVAATAGGLPALILGPHDPDSANMLRAVLDGSGLAFTPNGPLLLLPDVRNRLPEIETLFKNKLSPVTLSSVSAAYVPGGAATSEQIMAALLTARPMSELINNLEHEWVREALGDGWLFSVFHPIIHAHTGELFAQEALLRARNPHTNQVLGAGQIIGACEKLKLQHQLDQRARQAAILGAAKHAGDAAKVFINFLPNTIYDPAICLRTTMEAAAEANLPMSRLVFEVVETEKIPDMDHLRHILSYYRDRGVGTAIDDMGAGFTGVDYITALQPNFVKLDRELVLTAEATDSGRRQMDALIGASHDHGAKVIAEGIETVAHMDLCVNAGVDLLQGFLFAKPACPPQKVTMPAASAAAARIAA
jgi:diguanylate cyclase (GGDEF)-like protein/PAS domain S-box-containing protein